MKRCFQVVVVVLGIAMLASIGLAQYAATAGPYKLLRTVKVGGAGGFDYVYADSAGRRLYAPRSGPTGRIMVFDLDTLKPIGEIPNANGHGVAVDPKGNHGFLTTNPISIFITKTFPPINTNTFHST